MATAVALRNIESLAREHLIEKAAKTGDSLIARLRRLEDHPNVGEVRGRGLLIGVELVEDKTARKFFEPAGKVAPAIVAALLKRDVIARAMPQGDILGFAPPLCLNRDEADIIGNAAKEAIIEVLG